MSYSLNEVLSITDSETFALRYMAILEKESEGNVLLAELILCMDDLEHAKPSWFDKFNAAVIVDFLTISHRHYLKTVLPSIERQLDIFAKQQDCPALISEFGLYFFRQFRSGLISHFKYEEEQLFPAALKMLDSSETSFDAENFKAHHPQSLVDLNGLMMLMNSNLDTEERSMSHRILIEKLNSLNKELSLHEFIEDGVLLERLNTTLD
jgi:iron-sulfur cluster repair protein YtfE (RIC family)